VVLTSYDLILRNGKVITGVSQTWFETDIAVRDGRIVRIGYLKNVSSDVVIDVKGKYVVPGFIDMHNHSDISIIAFPEALNSLMQGVTTIVIGNCGFSAAPVLPKSLNDVKRFWSQLSLGISVDITWNSFDEYLRTLERIKPAVNIVPLVGHGTLRINAAGFTDYLSSEALGIMKELTVDAMKSGAFGISTGLIYPPSSYASINELVELAKIVSGYGGIYSTHIRSESHKLLDAVKEALEVGLNARLPVEISHLKAAGRSNWGKVREVIDLIKKYREYGVEVNYDIYPYTAGSTSLTALLPQPLYKDGLDKLISKLSDKEFREEVIKLVESSSDWENLLSILRWDDIVISYSWSCKSCEGRNILELSRELGKNPYDIIFDLICSDQGRTLMVMHFMSEEDLIYGLKQPYSLIGSDSLVIPPGIGKPHPRFFGTFPRVIKRYVKDLGILSLEEAIAKMSSIPAQKLRLNDRGIIAPGFKADLVILDIKNVEDRATFEDPNNYPAGIDYVIVNGSVSVSEGEYVKIRNGEVVKNPATLDIS